MPFPRIRNASSVRGYDAAVPYTASARSRAVARSLARTYGLREVTSWPIAAIRIHCIVFELPPATAREAVLARLANDPNVRHAQPLNAFVTASSANGGYNDPYADLQRSLREMAIPAAHRWSRGRGVSVAVIDTGIDTRHPDLAGRVRASFNFVDRDRARFDRDRHGTEVAGIIAALADNSVGIVGVAPEVELLAIKACRQLHPDADAAVCNSLTLAQGLAAAIDARADLVNLSVIGPADPLLAELIAETARRGIIVVGAAGFPARVGDLIAVDAARPRSTSVEHFYAPGDDIFTLTPTGGYGFASGSSLATAHVSGVVALLLSRAPKLQAADVRRLLAAATLRLDTPLGELRSVNACAALAEMLAQGPCPAPASGVVALHEP
jgi:hypothetical protein